MAVYRCDSCGRFCKGIWAAVCLLALLTSGCGVDQQMSELKAKDPEIRRRAVVTLGEMKDPRAVEPLIAALGDEQMSVQVAAVQALANIGAPAVQPLIAGLNAPSLEVRRFAARALGEIKDPRAVEPLIAALNDPHVRKETISALVKIKDPRAVEPLIAALKQGFGSSAARHQSSNSPTQGPILALKDVLVALPSGDSMVARALKGFGAPAVEPLIDALKDPYPGVRLQVTWALGGTGDPRAVEPLVATAVKDPDSDVRGNAAKALEGITDPRAVQPLVAALRNSDSRVRLGAARALGNIGAPAVEPLIAALKERNSGVRYSAAMALGRIQDPRAVSVLQAAWRERDHDLVAGAVSFFIERGEPGTEDALIQELHVSNSKGMAEALLSSGNPTLEKAASEWVRARGYLQMPLPTTTPVGGRWGSRR